VVTAGPGAKNTLLGCLNFSWYDVKRARYKQAGRGGIGTVFADKGIRALVARWDTVTADTNNPADKNKNRDRYFMLEQTGCPRAKFKPRRY
jgi:aldehyde:ferredoxin oxidoreductase